MVSVPVGLRRMAWSESETPSEGREEQAAVRPSVTMASRRMGSRVKQDFMALTICWFWARGSGAACANEGCRPLVTKDQRARAPSRDCAKSSEIWAVRHLLIARVHMHAPSLLPPRDRTGGPRRLTSRRLDGAPMRRLPGRPHAPRRGTQSRAWISRRSTGSHSISRPRLFGPQVPDDTRSSSLASGLQ